MNVLAILKDFICLVLSRLNNYFDLQEIFVSQNNSEDKSSVDGKCTFLRKRLNC